MEGLPTLLMIMIGDKIEMEILRMRKAGGQVGEGITDIG